MQTFRRIRRSVAAVLLVLYLPGCYHLVTPQGMTPQEFITTKHPKRVWLTLNEGGRLVLRDPWASADSIGGQPVVQEGGHWRKVGPPQALPLSSVVRFGVMKQRPGPAAGAALAVVGLIFWVAVVCRPGGADGTSIQCTR